MRSRYTAFVLENEAYLLHTWQKTNRPGKLEFDGIVAVGGDGIFHEVLNGVLEATLSNKNKTPRLAHIPCGSTDAGKALGAHSGGVVAASVGKNLSGGGSGSSARRASKASASVR